MFDSQKDYWKTPTDASFTLPPGSVEIRICISDPNNVFVVSCSIKNIRIRPTVGFEFNSVKLENSREKALICKMIKIISFKYLFWGVYSMIEHNKNVHPIRIRQNVKTIWPF